MRMANELAMSALLLPAEPHCQMRVQVCGGVALDRALMGWGVELRRGATFKYPASSLAHSPGLYTLALRELRLGSR